MSKKNLCPPHLPVSSSHQWHPCSTVICFPLFSALFFFPPLFLVLSRVTLCIHHHFVRFWFFLPECRGILSTLAVLNLPMNGDAHIKKWHSEVLGVLTLFLLIVFLFCFVLKIVEGHICAWTFVTYVQFSIGQVHITLWSHFVRAFCWIHVGSMPSKLATVRFFRS